MSEKQDLGTVDLTVRTLNVLQNVNAPNISRIETKTIQNTADAVIIRAEVQAEIAVVTGLANVAQATATAAKFRVITALTDAAQYLNEIVWYQSQLYRCTTLSPVAWALESAIQPSSTGLVAAWPGEEVPEIPDGVALQRYVGFTGTGVLAASGCTVALEGARLKLTITTTSWYCFFATISAFINQTLRVKFQAPAGRLVRLFATGIASLLVKSVTASGQPELIDGFNTVSNTRLMINNTAWTIGDIMYIDAEYIGDGSYATPSVDGSGNKNHGTVTGVTPCEGNHGKALIGDGIDDIITFPAKAASARTFAAWVKFTATTADMRVMQVNNAADTFVVFALVVNAKKAKFRWSTAVPADAIMEGVVDLNDDSWHLLAGTHNGTTAILYVDGIEVNRATSTLLNDAYSLGSIFSNRALSARYAGAIGEVWNYSRALSAQELRGLALGLRPSLPYSLVDWRTDPANPANVVATTAPRYLGSLTADPSSGMNTGDYYFRNNVAPKKIRRWSGTAWADVDSSDAQYGMYIGAAINDMAAAAVASGDDGFTFFSNLVTLMLCTMKIISDNKTGTGAHIPVADRDKERVEFDLHNSLLTLRDDTTVAGVFRKILLGAAQGMKAYCYDSSGGSASLVHDIPNANVITGFRDSGHLYHLNKSASLVTLDITGTTASASVSTTLTKANVDISSILPSGITNAKALLCVLDMGIGYSNAKGAVAAILIAGVRYSNTYNVTPDVLIASREVWAQVASVPMRSFERYEIIIPINYSGGVPYITVDSTLDFSNMATASGSYYLNAYLFAVGFYV
jgi:hypothetical protein